MNINEILNEVDRDGNPYFSEEQKKELLQEWKNINEKFFPAFTQTFAKDKNQMELNRLLGLIKNPEERKYVEKEANYWSLKNNKHPMHYVAKYLLSRKDPYTMKEEYILDLTKGMNGSVQHLEESFLRQFGWLIQKILERMFGSSDMPVRVKGSQEQIKSLARALAAEKDYMVKFQEYELDSPHIYRSKEKLKIATDKFERATGIKWPFK